jgi:protein phosphatase
MTISKGEEAHDTDEFLDLDDRLKRFYETEPRAQARVEVAGRTHPGNVRPSNEDQFLVVRRYRGRDVLATSLPREMLQRPDDHAYSLAVADGMGGRAFGEIASMLALMTGWELGGDEVKWTVRVNPREEEELREKADVFFRVLNQSILRHAGENPRLAGMGTTLTVCYTTGDQLFVLHAGDSRAYLLREGTFERLTRDHNLAQLLIDTGIASPDSPEARKTRHVLTNVLGGPDAGISVDVSRHRLAEGDTLLLCTDGLNDLVQDDEIARALESNPEPADACRVLVDLALERGGRDNVTVVVARYHFDQGPSDSPAHSARLV